MSLSWRFSAATQYQKYVYQKILHWANQGTEKHQCVTTNDPDHTFLPNTTSDNDRQSHRFTRFTHFPINTFDAAH